ncbi:MAG: hypothetical protein JNM80_05600 [Phycisphaerae bacterium]|nr:hypothetical protein [Phycisphaerae bacterium]
MHTVTKALVVFAALLLVLLSALTMAYSINADRIIQDRRSIMDAKRASDEMASSKISQAAEEQARLNGQIEALNKELTSRAAKISSLESERAQLIAQVRAAEDGRASIAGQIGQLGETNRTQALLIQNYRDEVTKLRDNELNYRKREIELVDRNNDLESQVEVLRQSTRALQEQLVEARRTIDAGGVALGALGGSSGGPYTPSIALAGTVNKVFQDPATKKPMAEINIGTNNQVREGMELTVSRGDQFVAKFIVSRVDLNWSVGEIRYLEVGRGGQPKNEVRQNDRVGTLSAK